MHVHGSSVADASHLLCEARAQHDRLHWQLCYIILILSVMLLTSQGAMM